MKKFLSLDLELTQPTCKIIQVGIAIGSLEESEKDWIKKKWYIDPKESITEEITKLTGISNEDIKKYAQPISVVAKELSQLITKNDCFVNPVTWGAGDSSELLDLFRSEDLEFKHFGRRWIDVKTLYTFLSFAQGTSNPAGGLSSCMGRYKLQFIGDAHRADVDAFNTLRFFFALIKRQQNFEQVLKTFKEMKS